MKSESNMKSPPLSEYDIADLNGAIIGTTPLAEVSVVRKLIDIERSKKLKWIWLALILFAILIYNALGTKVKWTPDPYNAKITYTESSLFGRTRIVHCVWRKDSNGELGWCAKNKDGSWYIFIDYLDPIYDNNSN